MFESMTRRYLVLAILGLSAPCLAGGMPKQFQLGRYIPQRCWLYTTAAQNTERAWLDEQWGQLWSAVRQSGVEQDVRDLVLSLTPEEQRASVGDVIDSLTDILRVGADFVHAEEIAFSETLTDQDSRYEYILLFRFKPDEAQREYQKLIDKLKVLSNISDRVAFSQDQQQGIKVWKFSFREAGDIGPVPPTGIVFCHNEVVGVVAGTSAARDVLGMLRGKSHVVPIVENKKFQKALAQVPAPEDSLMYFNFPAALKDIRQLIKVKINKHAAAANQGPLNVEQQGHIKTVERMIDKVMTILDLSDYTITSTETVDRQQRTHSVTALRDRATDTPLVRAMYDRKPFEKFDRFIPVDAKSFNLSGGTDLEVVYDTIMELIQEGAPEGQQTVTNIKRKFDSFGFDPHRDLFSWLSGESISITLPASMVSPLSGDDWIWMVRVKDAALASSAVDRAIGFINGVLQAQGQTLMISPATVKAEGFQRITHPMIAMFLAPVVGVNGDWLIVGSNAAAVNKCLAVAAGQAPSIMKNKRFLEQGLVPQGPVRALTFTDTTSFGQATAATVGGLAMGLNMASMSLMPAMNAAEGSRDKAKIIGGAIQRISGILAKAGSIVVQLDFYSSQATMSSFDGRLSRTEKVVTYKSPAELGEAVTAKN